MNNLLEIFNKVLVVEKLEGTQEEDDFYFPIWELAQKKAEVFNDGLKVSRELFKTLTPQQKIDFVEYCQQDDIPWIDLWREENGNKYKEVEKTKMYFDENGDFQVDVIKETY
jgi:hypothetical protein